MDTIYFTDRYGNNRPKLLTICNGLCEGMGVHPVRVENIPTPQIPPLEEGEIEDGWRFIRCSICKGTGKCDWLTVLRRIPTIFWKNMKFLKENLLRFEIKPSHQSKAHHMWNVIKISITTW